ncbi:MAG TPA: hypothetical protein DCG24_00265, partial [Bacteroidetes bacterium]|nr:hypothetical protein [Bacteroidota bacterium]
MNRSGKLFLFLLTITGVVSCKQVDSTNLPYSIGTVDEMVVVLNSVDSTDTLFRVIDEYLGASYGYTPQPERRFNVIYADMATYQNTFERHRNLVFIGDLEQPTAFSRFIGELVGEDRVAKLKQAGNSFYLPLENMWSHPQYVEAIVAADRDLLLADLDNILTGLLQRVSDRELNKIRSNQYVAGHNLQVEEALADAGINLQVPADFKALSVSKENFWFLRKSTIDMTASIMIYWEPYSDSAQLKPEYVLHLRDSLGLTYESSKVANSFMQTEYRVAQLHEQIDFNGAYALRSRGLWRLVNDFMGGPYINFWVYDEQHNRMVYLDGYV